MNINQTSNWPLKVSTQYVVILFIINILIFTVTRLPELYVYMVYMINIQTAQTLTDSLKIILYYILLVFGLGAANNKAVSSLGQNWIFLKNLISLLPFCSHIGTKQLFYLLSDLSPTTKRKPGSASSSKKHSPDPHWSTLAKRTQNRHDSDSDQSPPRKKPLKGHASDSDQSPPRRHSKKKQDSDSDQSPPRRRPQSGDGDLSPPRRPGQSQVRIHRNIDVSMPC